jgi:hypothetical protein
MRSMMDGFPQQSLNWLEIVCQCELSRAPNGSGQCEEAAETRTWEPKHGTIAQDPSEERNSEIAACRSHRERPRRGHRLRSLPRVRTLLLRAFSHPRGRGAGVPPRILALPRQRLQNLRRSGPDHVLHLPLLTTWRPDCSSSTAPAASTQSGAHPSIGRIDLSAAKSGRAPPRSGGTSELRFCFPAASQILPLSCLL